MFQAAVYDATLRLKGFETKGPGSIRARHLESAVVKAQTAVLAEYRDAYVTPRDRPDYGQMSEGTVQLELTVIVPVGDHQYDDYLSALETFKYVLRSQLDHPEDQLELVTEDRAA